MTLPIQPFPTASASPHRVLVLGAAGRFGAAATAAFAAAGWQVLAQARRPLPGPPRGVVRLAEPLDDSAALVRAAAGAQVVVYAVNPVYTDWRAQALPLARLGLDVAERLGAVFMLPGNVYGFGRAMPAVLREDTPQQPDTVKGAIRAAMEAEIAARGAHGLGSVVIRAGDFFGAGSGSWLDLAIVKSLGAGKLVYPGPLDVPHAWAYLPDLAQAFVAVAGRLVSSGSAAPVAGLTRYHFAGHTLTGAQLLDAIERAARAIGAVPDGRALERGGLPWGLIRFGGLVVPMWRELAEMAYLWQRPHQLDGTLLAQRIGAAPATPIDDALRASLRALGHGTPGRRDGATEPAAA